MKNIVTIFFILTCFSLAVKAQKPEELLTSWSEKSPIEKAYLHFDRDNYLAGETVWFKGYLYSDFYPDTISTTLYVELQNAASAIVSSVVLPVVFGNTKGQFELPDTLATGNYYIKAYSTTMLNHSHEFLFQRSIYINGKKKTVTNTPLKKTVKVDFFAESGNFVAGLPNTIALKITDEYGLPLDMPGIVKNETGDSIAEFSCYHDGMGMFDINPSKDVKYHVVLKDDPLLTKYYLPAVSGSGLVFRLMPRPGGRYFELYQQPGTPSLKPDYMIGQMQHRVVFKMKLNGEKNDLNGFINTQQLKSGVLQVTVFNKDGMPLAERLSFIDNKEYLQKAELITDTVNFSEKGKNHFTLSFPDTVGGSFSLAITDPSYSTEAWRKENMISQLLLTSDLKGIIHNPVYYFSAEPDSAKNAIDLLMMTNGWRRFKWTELGAIAAASPRYRDPGYITITGKVNIRDTKKPLSQKELFLLLISMEDSLNSSMEFMGTDDQGKFRLDSLIFFGKTNFFVSDMQGKKNKWLDIYPDADSITTSFGLSPGIKQILLPAGEGAISSRLAYDYENILKAKGEMLEGITVKTKKKSAIQELEERYASGLFSGLTEKTIDLVNGGEKIYQNNIFDYIQGRVPGIKVVKNGINYQLFYRNRFSLFGGPIPMLVYLDEMQTDARLVATIPANQVSMIKVFSSFVGAEGNGAGGVLAVYTKKGADLSNSLSTSGDIFQYKGYSVIKEFYAPDYSSGKPLNLSSSQKDQRITLHWQPDIIVDGVDTKVPVQFYNNERSRSFKVVVEGMTSEGKMVFIEKIITPDKKAF
jgi:hypothetical protein